MMTVMSLLVGLLAVPVAMMPLSVTSGVHLETGQGSCAQGPRSFGGTASGDAQGFDVEVGVSAHCGGQSSSFAAPQVNPPILITTTKACDAIDGSRPALLDTCEALAVTQIATCDPILGYRPQTTMIQTLRPDGTYTTPVLNSVIVCNTAPEAPPIVVTEADFRALPLVPPVITVGPAQGWVPVNMATIVYTDPHPQVITTTLLGQPVTVRATPAQFTWGWADGSTPTVTTDPGRPWPDHTVAHDYLRTGEYTVTMTTTWTGEYSLDAGTTYTPIDGTAMTTSTAPPLTVRELRTHLVEDLIS